MKTRARHSGFSLIELLMVIAIVVILIAMLLPALNIGKERTDRIICLGHLRTLTAATVQYAADHQGELVDSYPGGGLKNWVGGGNSFEENRRGALWPYVGDDETYMCPSIPEELTQIRKQVRHYSINNYLNGHGWYPAVVKTFGAIPKPNLTMAFIEEPDPRGSNLGSWVMRIFDDAWVDPIGFWHDYGSNFSFADGHVEHWKWEDPRTEIPGLEGRFFVAQPGNKDLKRVQRHQMPGDPNGMNP